ncbi:MAG: efflux RND transporter periplasmic adaptor subunit [Isosphaeraceae bacterium]
MCRVLKPTVPDRSPGCRRLAFWLLAALVAPGCHNEAETDYASASEPPAVRLISPSVRNIVRVVGQPSFIEAYERTSIYPKLTGFIEKWSVDIGDRVKKGQVLATLFVPELVEDHGTKKATVGLDKERIELAIRLVKVAEADVQSADASLAEARAILNKYQAEVDRWASEDKRLANEVKRGVVDAQILLESNNQLKSSTAARDAAKATIMKAEAQLLSEQATLAKAIVDVSVARADLVVAESEARRLKAWVGYLALTAPFDGVIVARNANTFDFVLPTTGDPSAMERSPYQAPGGTAAPIYVVDRIDVVRIFVDIPAEDANHVHIGTKASVLVKDYRDEPIPGNVTRTSWALNLKSRTLRAEIDLPNTGSQILPGMYAYAEVIVERPGVRALPLAALTHRGDQASYWKYEDGKAVQTEIQTGVSDGEWIEVTHCRAPASRTTPAGKRPWTSIDGSEKVILGDLSILTEGAPVREVTASTKTKELTQN